MFRFTIRDVLWLTVVVGLALTCGIQHYRTKSLRSDLERSKSRLSGAREQLYRLAALWKRAGSARVTINNDYIIVDMDTSSHHFARHPSDPAP
jgi:hypothetical protein